MAVAAPAPAKPFEKLTNCRLKTQPFNDGDSFHVTLADKREIIVRLCFVDCPETDDSFPDRVAEQAQYFGVTSDQAMEIGKQAREFTKAALSRPFVIQTRWRNALGRSTLPRSYAMITTVDGKDLNELLVSAGLARIYGTRTPLPDGGTSRAYLARLATLETEARKKRLGGWSRR